mmetsp:Transcript_62169/g.115369  ORF Transcript_62169/g.115369 Transcript_62169/m.115369 type:complete len:235 (+) Transcript_62169:49-753(+)
MSCITQHANREPLKRCLFLPFLFAVFWLAAQRDFSSSSSLTFSNGRCSRIKTTFGRHAAERVQTQRRKLALRAAPAKRMPAKKAPAPAKLIKDGDTIFLKGHLGNYLNVESNRDEVYARAPYQADRATLKIYKEGGGAISSGDTVFVEGYRGGFLEIVQDQVRCDKSKQDIRRAVGLLIKKKSAGQVCHGDTIYLRGGSRKPQNFIDIDDQQVQARWPDMGDWQALVIESEAEL